MSITADAGPLLTIGWETPLGSATATVGATGAPAGYVSGQNENPDAGPNCFFAGNMVKDPLARYRQGGGGNVAGGYPNQGIGFVDNNLKTLSIVPSAVATANIAALSAPTLNVPLVLVAVSGAGITVLSASTTVLNSGLVIPSGSLQIDAAPSWVAYGTSGAMQGWQAAACGRALSLTSTANLGGITFTVVGFDLYGRPQTEAITGPNNNTVNGKKGWKWITSVTPNTTNAGTVSVGTADIFEFPIRCDAINDTTIWWNNTLVTSATGFVAADTTSPATSLTGSPRGTYAVSGAVSDGVRRLAFSQTVRPGNLATSPPSLGIFGVVPA